MSLLIHDGACVKPSPNTAASLAAPSKEKAAVWCKKQNLPSSIPAKSSIKDQPTIADPTQKKNVMATNEKQAYAPRNSDAEPSVQCEDRDSKLSNRLKRL